VFFLELVGPQAGFGAGLVFYNVQAGTVTGLITEVNN